MDIKVGILVPRSYTVPLITQQIARGIKLGFEVEEVSAQFFIEDIGKAVDPDLVMAKTNNLLLNEVDLIFAMPGTKVDIPLVNLCDASKKPLIIIEAGAAITRNDEMPFSPYVFTNSYNMWHNCILLGQYTGKFIGEKVLSTGAFFEAGYSFLPAFEYGLHKAGGIIVGSHLCKDFKPEDFTVQLADIIESVQPNVLVAFYNGKDADDFYNYAVKTGVTKNLPVVTTSLTAAAFGGEKYPLTSIWIWDGANTNAGNKKFVNAYTAKHRAMPDEYSAISYESALASAAAIKKVKENYFDADEFCRLLKETTVYGPRGEFSFNPETMRNYAFGTAIISNGQTVNVQFTSEDIEAAKQHFSQWPHSGWYNPYPCA
ncbi:MAG TPA: ABC transporter substrate-binding protein [Bacteroidia bacterium]|nr:ABC transporter substrate-binding protein [Bacteroidia bacterium]